MEKPVHISVVSPVYRADKIVQELVKQVKENLLTITEDFEIILVNDASPDNSWVAIETECKKDKRVKGINLVETLVNITPLLPVLAMPKVNGWW